MSSYTCCIKPVVDPVAALLLLIALSPLLLLISLAVAIVFRSTPIFRQRRAGRLGRGFTLYKFRTMQQDHIPLLGRILRTSSLDELPQLVNILLGQMSFIGPRPLYLYYVQLYNSQQIRRLDIKPGLTGWAQVNGRNQISWQQKFELDIYYVDHISCKLDVQILYRTLLLQLHSLSHPATEPPSSEYFNGEN